MGALRRCQCCRRGHSRSQLSSCSRESTRCTGRRNSAGCCRNPGLSDMRLAHRSKRYSCSAGPCRIRCRGCTMEASQRRRPKRTASRCHSLLCWCNDLGRRCKRCCGTACRYHSLHHMSMPRCHIGIILGSRAGHCRTAGCRCRRSPDLCTSRAGTTTRVRTRCCMCS